MLDKQILLAKYIGWKCKEWIPSPHVREDYFRKECYLFGRRIPWLVKNSKGEEFFDSDLKFNSSYDWLNLCLIKISKESLNNSEQLSISETFKFLETNYFNNEKIYSIEQCFEAVYNYIKTNFNENHV